MKVPRFLSLVSLASVFAAKEKLAGEKVDNSDMKSKARILRAVIKDIALTVNINLD